MTQNLRSKITGETVLQVTNVKQVSETLVVLGVIDAHGVGTSDIFNATAEQITAIEDSMPSFENPVAVTVVADYSDDGDSHPEVVSVN